jgi:hypothetical protein
MQFIIGKHHGYNKNTNMISIKLQGGIGNAMFQIATIETLGQKHGQLVCYTNVDAWLDDSIENYAWIRHAEEYLTIFPNIDFYKNHNERFRVIRKIDVPFRYTKIEADNGYLLNGYFQSEENFPDHEFIKNLFAPSDRIKEGLNKYNSLLQGISCSIHVRRGNYRNLQNYHPVLTLEYYNKAINIMKSNGVTRFLVFSNDQNWCKNSFIGDEFTFVEDIDYIELFLMSKCPFHIISNGSFAWWGAWLGDTEKTSVIAPEVWFGNNLPTDHALDIVPKRWLKI